MRKVGIIGLDGMTWRILKPLINEGIMPNIEKHFIKGGSFGFLKSVLPPITSPAWTTILTGVNPGKHGIFNFFKIKYDYSTRILNSYDVNYPRIHQMFTQLGYRSVVINVPHSVPFLMLNGIGISDWLSGKTFTYPAHLAQEIEYIIPIPHKSPTKDGFKEVIKLKEQLELNINTMEKLLTKYSWDSIIAIFSEPDFLFHALFDKIVYRKNEKLLDLIYDIFSKIDKFIDFVIKKNDDGVTAIVSDHGFTMCHKPIHIISMLSRLKLIHYTMKHVEKRLDAFNRLAYQRGFFRTVKIPSLLYNLILNIKNIPLFSQLFDISMTLLKRTFGTLPIAEYGKTVDYFHSLIIPYVPNGVALLSYLNTKSRFQHGKLNSHTATKVQELLVHYLRNLRDKKGNRLFSLVEKPENLYHGPYVAQAPHVIAIPNLDVGYYLSLANSGSQTIFTHNLKGIALFHGKNIKKNYYFETVNACDIVPTLLYLAKLPLPKFMDGEVLYKIIEKKYNKILIKDYLSKYQLTLKIHKFKNQRKLSVRDKHDMKNSK